MSQVVSCPECGRALQVPESFFGRMVQCPDCKQTFEAKPPDGAIQVSAPAPWADEPEPPRPRRAEWEDDRDSDEFDDLSERLRRDGQSGPERGGVILALGIISLAVSVISFMLYIVPIWLIPLCVGTVGWIMGYRDLKAMRETRYDPHQHVMTMIGMILSIVGAAISIGVGILGCSILGIFGVMFCGMAAFAPPPPQQPGPKRGG